MQYIPLVLQALGALSGFCAVLSAVPGKFGRVMGEIGVDLAGLVKEIKS